MVAPFSFIQPYIIQSESSGQNVLQHLVPVSVSTASGYYQITNSTWNSIPSSITGGYPTAMSAPFDTQTAAAEYLWNNNNGNDWIPYNSQVAAANQAYMNGQQPSLSISQDVQNLINGNATASSTDGTGTTPMSSQGSGGLTYTWPDDGSGTGNIDTSGASDYGGGQDIAGGYGATSVGTAPTPTTASGDTPAQASSWWNTVIGDVYDWMSRFGLIILAIVFLGIAAYFFVKKEGAPKIIEDVAHG